MSDIDDLRALFNTEYGKKARTTRADPNAEAKERNKAWHIKNPVAEGGARSYAKAQLEASHWRTFYDWERHRLISQQEAAAIAEHGLPDLEWTPEARITTLIRQYCGVCGSCTEFIGNEYIRFRGRRRLFKELGGGEHYMSPTVLRPAAQCDPNLIQFGLPDGTPLADLTEEMEERVSRCPGCIAVEQQAWRLLEAIAEGERQASLPEIKPALNLEGFDQLMKETGS